ncbi:L,D-transpeptidase family protein [Syntrophomonas wolfei]|nr:peptidoglycan-binding protein [Syntrophomonas wolfei]
MSNMVYASRFLRLEKIRMSGPDIHLMQKRLKELGYNPGVEDGIFGEQSEAALKAFQASRGLVVDGVVDPNTWLLLEPSSSIRLQNKREGQAWEQPRISIDVVKRRLTYTSGSFKKTYPVAVGKPQTPTPLGNWTIVQKTVNPGGPFGARWMRLSVPWGGYGIHGTNRPSSIGKAVSHGCVRMYNADVIELYDRTPLGTPVNIFGKANTGRVLSRGDQGSDVKEVQRMLRTLGYYRVKPDGKFGPKTEAAVIAFQRDNQLIADGIVGPYTHHALQKAYDLAINDVEP